MQTTLLLLVDRCITAASAPMIKACDLVTSVTFCYFHFWQALYRNLGQHNLKKEYDENEIFCLKMKKLTALAFVPVSDKIEIYVELIEQEFSNVDEGSARLFSLLSKKLYRNHARRETKRTTIWYKFVLRRPSRYTENFTYAKKVLAGLLRRSGQ